MFDDIESLPRKLQLIIVTVLVAASLLLLSLLGTTTSPPKSHVTAANLSTSSMPFLDDSPNMVTTSFYKAWDALDNTAFTLNQTVENGKNAVKHASSHSGALIAQGLGSIGHFFGSYFAFMGRTLLHTTGFALSIPLRVLDYISYTPMVSAMIRPAATVPVPVIDPGSASLFRGAAMVSKTEKTAAAPAAVPVAPATQWPIHGMITTPFGVPELPYQPIHTGLDISDGRAPGVTPIYAFKAGQVINVIYSRSGLGNHVIVDHGNGLTSVYGHLHDISVQVGQQVDLQSIIGHEGSTGVSTGTHLHFEVRVNGQPVDPHGYISGQP